ncbi:MAG: LLM class flavin-dependent oxidoreductase [Pseudobdellovibrio sp.]
MNTPISFINVIPANDRRLEGCGPTDLDKYIDKSAELDFKYTLITVGNKRLDPWVVAQYALQKNKNFKPLVATNPAHQHPVALIKKLISLQNIYGRQVAINLVTGSFVKEFAAQGELLNFEERSERLLEFLTICRELTDKNTFSFTGKHYSLENVDIYPAAKEICDFFISGSFEINFMANSNKTFFVKNIRPIEHMRPAIHANSGLGLGICARKTDAEALVAAQQLFPTDRAGELLFSMSVANSETPWSVWLKEYLAKNSDERLDFYLKPIKNYLSPEPYLVGSYENVCAQLQKYIDIGYRFFLTDFHKDDFDHVKICIDLVKKNN